MLELVICFAISFSLLFLFRQLAKKIQLLDISNDRKHHQEAVPLIGGVAIFFTFLLLSWLLNPESTYKNHYLMISGLLVLLGFFDDKFELSYKLRLSIQTVAAFLASFFADLSILNLGILVGDAPFFLPVGIDYLVTVIAIVGAINAFNMIDGLDGLLGSLACVSLSAIGLLFWLNAEHDFVFYCLTAIASILPFVLLNLGVPFGKRFKVFMGDAGSTLIGFTILWLLIRASQHPVEASIKTATALWFIAIPLMDMAAVIMRRIQQRSSPFKAGRDHIHHILLNLGFSPLQTLFMVLALAVLMAGIGIVGELLHVQDIIIYALFIFGFVIYSFILNRLYQPQKLASSGKLSASNAS